MSMMVYSIGRGDPQAVEIHVCPLFSTAKGLERVLSSAQRGATDATRDAGKDEGKGENEAVRDIVVSSWTSRIVGYDPTEMIHDLFSLDLAFCIQTRSHFVITSLFQTLGILDYRMSTKKPHCFCDMNHTVFDGKNLVVHAEEHGGSAVVFQHKVADAVSIPTDWFLLGPTLRTEIEKRCLLAFCDVSESIYDIGVCPMSNMVRFVDGMRRIPSAARTNDERQRHANGTDGRKQKKESFDSDPYRFVWSDGYMSPRSGDKLVVAKERLAPLFDQNTGRHKMYRGVHLRKMPVYAPLVEPISACGSDFARKHVASRLGDPFHMSDTEAMVGMSDTKGSPGARCVHPPYKHVLGKHLDTLVHHQGKAHLLADILSLSDKNDEMEPL